MSHIYTFCDYVSSKLSCEIKVVDVCRDALRSSRLKRSVAMGCVVSTDAMGAERSNALQRRRRWSAVAATTRSLRMSAATMALGVWRIPMILG